MLLYLKELGRNEDLTLRQLALKTAMLLSILVGRRLHTLHKLETSKMNISDVGGKVNMSYYRSHKMLKTLKT